MAGPKLKLFGSLDLAGIKKAVVEIPGKVGEYQGNKQLKVSAAQWDDGGISIEIWNGEKKESIKLGNLRVSTLDGQSPAAAAPSSPANDDLPF